MANKYKLPCAPLFIANAVHECGVTSSIACAAVLPTGPSCNRPSIRAQSPPTSSSYDLMGSQVQAQTRTITRRLTARVRFDTTTLRVDWNISGSILTFVLSRIRCRWLTTHVVHAVNFTGGGRLIADGMPLLGLGLLLDLRDSPMVVGGLGEPLLLRTDGYIPEVGVCFGVIHVVRPARQLDHAGPEFCQVTEVWPRFASCGPHNSIHPSRDERRHPFGLEECRLGPKSSGPAQRHHTWSESVSNRPTSPQTDVTRNVHFSVQRHIVVGLSTLSSVSDVVCMARRF